MNIFEINRDLDALNIGVSVEVRGKRVYLRATLPPKPGTGKPTPSRQRIALGVFANEQGLQRAKAEAIKLGGLIACGDFDWALYGKNDIQTCGEWVAAFELDYFSKRGRSPKTITTYRSSYQQIFNKLRPGRKLTKAAIVEVVTVIPPDSRQRVRACLALGKLAEFAGIVVDLRGYRGGYSHQFLTPRTLPMDQVIAKTIKAIPNPSWRWAYGILAAYGLRPHEVFFADLSDPPLLYIREGKTGPRHVSPLYPEWVGMWGLLEGAAPPWSGKKDYSALGARVTRQFYRYDLPFTPYVLRHCYARRSKQFGIKPIDASKLMGHSLDVHFRTYHHWYEKDEVLAITHQIANNPDRPMAPLGENL
jgi:integrase